ncbi:type IV pilus biogenesis protein PilM [Geoalkalibacter sp.]|uniref:type IV pilus biogenesis protein PilM n=1 Tax=Geoalkalibacter sp. TaxID=3041440 RepID=UPI00272E48B1|nr:type IV pilus assembly protein PilM [Geoalkalibacter sp.]
MLFKSKKDIVGIDIGSSAVKLVQLKEVKGGYQLQNLGLLPLPPEAIVDHSIMDPTVVQDTVRNLVESLKIKTKNVATSISGHSVIIRKITLPIMSEEELESSIQWEAEQYIPFDINDVNIDFQILGPDAKDPSQMNVMLVAAKKDFVNDHVGVFADIGLTPVVMDIDCFAVENMFEASYGSGAEAIVALINIGASGMNVNILKAGESVFTRDIQVGGNMLNEELQKRLGVSGEDAERLKLGGKVEDVDAAEVAEVLADAAESLAQEVQRSLDFFSATSADEKVQKVFLAGGVSRSAQVISALEERLGIPIEVINPFAGIHYNEKEFDPEYVRAVGPLMSVATGLAMRRVGDK